MSYSSVLSICAVILKLNETFYVFKVVVKMLEKLSFIQNMFLIGSNFN